MVTFTYFMLGALFITVLVLLYVVINNSSSISEIKNSSLIDEHERKKEIDTVYRDLERFIMDLRSENESIIREYTNNHKEVIDLIDNRTYETNRTYDEMIKNLDQHLSLRCDDITRLIDSRVDKLDSKLATTTNKTYFDFNNLLNESILKEINTVKERLS